MNSNSSNNENSIKTNTNTKGESTQQNLNTETKNINYIAFKSLDNQILQIKLYLISDMLNIFQENLNEIKQEFIDKQIPINTKINSNILSIIFTFCTNHNGKDPPKIKRPLGRKKFNEIVQYDWEVQFFDCINLEALISVINACEILKCHSLADYCFARLAICIRDENLTNLASLLNLGDFNFNENIYSNVKTEAYNLMKIKKERIEELENDED